MTPQVPSLETLATSTRFFGLTTATQVQRAKWRALDGLPLGDLATDPAVLACFGGAIAVGRLPLTPPREFFDLSAVRVFKSGGGAAHIVHASQSVDVSCVRPGDIIRYHVAALKLDGTSAVMSHLYSAVTTKPALRSLVIGEPKLTGIVLRHPSGAAIEVTPTPIDRAGGSAVSVYSAGAFTDEFPRMTGTGDGVKNFDDFRSAVLGRMLPGATLLAVGSPWQPFGPAFDIFTQHFGAPSPDFVVVRTTGPAANPTWWTAERCADLQRRNALAYRTDCLAEFADGELAVFPSDAIADSFTELAHAETGTPAVFCDPSSLRNDTWAACVGAWCSPLIDPNEQWLWDDASTPVPFGQPRSPIQAYRGGFARMRLDADGNPVANPNAPKSFFKVFEIISWDGGARVAADELVATVARLGRKYGCTEVHSDQFEQFALRSMFEKHGFRFISHAVTSASKTAAVDRMRSLLVERRLKLPNHDRLRSELVRFRARPTPNGFSYVVPGQGHGDHASTIVTAMHAELAGYLAGSPDQRENYRFEIDAS